MAGRGRLSRARRLRIGAAAIAATLGLLAHASAAEAGSGKGAARTPNVYVVVLDGLDGDAVTAGNAPFIHSLIERGGPGAYFPRSSSVIPAETNPNHTAMMSGAYPGRSGIAANAFAIYSPLADPDGCRSTRPVDLTMLPSETSGESAGCPRAEFTFEAIRRQGAQRRVVSAGIFGKPKLGKIFAGQNFRAGRYDADYLWAPCDNEDASDDSYCDPSVIPNPATGYAPNDGVVMDEVIRSATEGVPKAGRMRRPDFTFVNLPQIDSAGHATGVGAVYRTAIRQADDQIRRLVATLREERLWRRSVLMLVSDHSMDATPAKISLGEAFEDAGIDAEDFLAVQNGSFDSIYLADRRAGSRFALLKRMRRAALALDGVDEVLYRRANPRDGGRRHTLAGVHPAWHTEGPRTGDLIATSDDGTAFSEGNGPLPLPSGNPLPGNHGSPLTADNFLAVSGGSPLIRPGVIRAEGRRGHPVNVDVAPTVMALLGLRAPAQSRGRVLSAAFRPHALRELRFRR